jgi:hypothetical protein
MVRGRPERGSSLQARQPGRGVPISAADHRRPRHPHHLPDGRVRHPVRRHQHDLSPLRRPGPDRARPRPPGQLLPVPSRNPNAGAGRFPTFHDPNPPTANQLNTRGTRRCLGRLPYDSHAPQTSDDGQNRPSGHRHEVDRGRRRPTDGSLARSNASRAWLRPRHRDGEHRAPPHLGAERSTGPRYSSLLERPPSAGRRLRRGRRSGGPDQTGRRDAEAVLQLHPGPTLSTEAPTAAVAARDTVCVGSRASCHRAAALTCGATSR